VSTTPRYRLPVPPTRLRVGMDPCTMPKFVAWHLAPFVKPVVKPRANLPPVRKPFDREQTAPLDTMLYVTLEDSLFYGDDRAE
jgi:hypothetical protein